MGCWWEVKPHFITFASGGYAWRATGRRIYRQARRSDYFSTIQLLGASEVKPLFTGEEFNANTKGFGYWRWKPRIVWAALQLLPPRSPGLWYVDAGSSFFETAPAKKRFEDYLEFGASQGAGAFFQLSEEFSEDKYTKGLAFDTIHVTPEMAKTGQIQATAFFLSNSDEGRELASEWSRLSYQIELFDDSQNFPADRSQTDSYAWHRHDQSILSLLLKARSVKAIPDELNFDRKELLISSLHPFPIAATRHRSGFESLSMNPAMRAIRAVEGCIP